MTVATDQFLAARDFLIKHRTDLSGARAGFQWPHLTIFNWAIDYFDVIARDNDRPALWIVHEDGSQQRCTFSEMSFRSNRAANWYRKLGVHRGDRVLLMLGNQLPLWESMLALAKLGAVVIPTTTLLDHHDLQDRIARGNVRHVICGSESVAKFKQVTGAFTRIVTDQAKGWESLESAQAESDVFVPDASTLATDPLLLYFTSGTTSKPKLVLHTHQSYPIGHLSTMYWMGLQSDDVHLNISSPGWAKHAWSSFYAPWNAGACVFVHNYGRFNARDALDILVNCGVTTMCAPPTVWRMMIQEDLAAWPVRLRELLSAGEPLNPEVIDRVREAWRLTIRDGFGQSESTCQIGNSPGQIVKAGSMGRPLPGYPIVLLDAEGQPADEGEICIDLARRPLGLMDGYAGNAAQTQQAMRGGFYRTGDMASRDDQGYITYIGRSDDVFKSSDYRLSPFELESVLIEHPQVVEAAVVPAPDPQRLSVPKAFIVLGPGVQPSRELALSLFRFSRKMLAPYKRIRRIEFAELPKTISGKIQRAQLRRLEAERSSRPTPIVNEFREEEFQELTR